MQLIHKTMDKFLTVVIAVSGFFLGVGAILYTFNSITRLFKYGVPWIEEYCIYTIVLMVFLMQAKLEFRDEHLSISFLADKVKDKPVPRRILFTIREIITIIAYSILFKVGVTVIQQNLSYGVVSPILSFPMGIYYTLINISLAMIIVYSFVNIFTKQWGPEDGESGVYDNV